MNIFNKVTLNTLKKNKTRTLVTIIGVILSAAMICAVTTFISSFQAYLLNASLYSVGDWYAKAENITEKDIDTLKNDEEVTQIAAAQNIGYAVIEESRNEDKPYIYILGTDKVFNDTMPIHLVSGKMPENNGEIILPESLYTNGGVAFYVGDTITLEVGTRVSGDSVLNQSNPYIYEEEEIIDTSLRTYKIVGIYERPSFEPYSAPGYTAITVPEDLEGASYDIYLKIRNAKDIFDFIDKYDMNFVSTNTDVLMCIGVSGYDNFYSVIYGMAAIVIVLIMLGSVALIYNAFAISVSERTKQFGLLSSIGATKKQLKQSVVFEALFVSAIGIPIGVICGIGGIGITLKLLESKFSSIFGSQVAFSLKVSWEAVAAACVIGLATVLLSAWIPSKKATKITAIEAIRLSNDINVGNNKSKSSKLTYKLFGLEGMIAQKYFKRSKKRYRATIISLFISVVLFISTNAYCGYLTDSVTESQDVKNYDIRVSVYKVGDEPLSENDIKDKFLNVNGVEDVQYAKLGNTSFFINEDVASDEYIKYLSEIEVEQNVMFSYSKDIMIYFIDDEEYIEYLEECGLDSSDFMDKEDPKAVFYDNLTYFDYDLGKYFSYTMLKDSVDSITGLKGKNLEGYEFYYTNLDNEGNIVFNYFNDSTGEEETFSFEEAGIATEYKIGARVSKVPMGLSSQYQALIYPYSSYAVLNGEENGDDFIEFYIKCDDHKEVYADVTDILYENGIAHSIFDLAESEENTRNLVLVINVFAYGFIVLISLISVANVFNTISTNISLRRREFAMLKSVGMTSRGFNKMMNFECVLYGTRALLFGIPVSVAVTYCIYKVIQEGFSTSFYLPWTAILIAVVSVFTVVFITMVYSMSKIKKDNPIDAMKNENL